MTLSAIYEDLWRIITMILYLFGMPIKFFNLAEFQLKNWVFNDATMTCINAREGDRCTTTHCDAHRRGIMNALNTSVLDQSRPEAS